MNIYLEIQKWSEKNHILVSEIIKEENFLVISLKDYLTIYIDDINEISKILKKYGWEAHTIDYNPWEKSMQIWFHK